MMDFLVGVDGFRLIVVRLVDVQAHFFDERGGDDEEDKHDEDHVQHRREINLLIVVFKPWIRIVCARFYPSKAPVPGRRSVAMLSGGV